MSSSRAPVVGCKTDMQWGENAGKVGLKNLGNTCFMNAGLQCLSHIEPLAAYFLNEDFVHEINTTSPLTSQGEVARAFADLQKALWQSEAGVHNPKALRQRLAEVAPHLFEGDEQQDVQEFLAFCLDGLHEDLNRVIRKPRSMTEEEEQEDERLAEQEGAEGAAALAWLRHLEQAKSFLVDLLQGQLRSSLTCSQCGYTSQRFDPFLYLSLPIAKTMSQVVDAIAKYLEVEELTGDEQWYCKRCDTKVDAKKKIDLWKLPPVLVLHLKRFEYDMISKKFEKTENRLSMKLSLLDLTEFCSSSQRDGATYNVVCVANHSGAFGSGHYTATCRVGGVGPGTWYHFNDEVVTPFTGRNVVTRETYVIFLMRNQDPRDISQNLGTPQKLAKNSSPLLLRRQTLSAPEDWPHPETSVSAVLNATGHASKNGLGAPTADSREYSSENSNGVHPKAVGAPKFKKLNDNRLLLQSKVNLNDTAAASSSSCDKGSEVSASISSTDDQPLKKQKTIDCYFSKANLR